MYLWASLLTVLVCGPATSAFLGACSNGEASLAPANETTFNRVHRTCPVSLKLFRDGKKRKARAGRGHILLPLLHKAKGLPTDRRAWDGERQTTRGQEGRKG